MKFSDAVAALHKLLASKGVAPGYGFVVAGRTYFRHWHPTGDGAWDLAGVTYVTAQIRRYGLTLTDRRYSEVA